MVSEEIQFNLQSLFQINSYITTDDKIIIYYTQPNSELFKYIINLTGITDNNTCLQMEVIMNNVTMENLNNRPNPDLTQSA